MKNLTLFLLLAVACNPAKQIQKNQAAIASIVSTANAERVIVKDSIVFVKGRTDSATFTIRDSANRIVQTNNFYHSSDTLKIITNDPTLERALLERAVSAEGKLIASNAQSEKTDRQFMWLVITIGCLSFACGGILFFKIKL